MALLGYRRNFREGDPRWSEYVAWIGLRGLHEVRSLDTSLNECVGSGDTFVGSSLRSEVSQLPALPPDGCFCLLAVNLGEERIPVDSKALGFELLGHDLADETRTSSLLNCGPWAGQLKPIASQVNEFGLLTLERACRAKELLPREWGDSEPHAHVDIWALFELIGSQSFGV